MANKIISKDQAGLEKWQAPDFSASRRSKAAVSRQLTAQQLEQLQRQAYQEGYDAGFRQGLNDGQARIQQQVQYLTGIIEFMNRPLQSLDEEIESELVALALTIARQIIRREIQTDEGQIVAVVREAVTALPVADNLLRIHLHPEDATVVRDKLSGTDGQGRWQIVDDPALTRGDCLVNTETSRIDATVERRLASIAARLLGGNREND